MILKNTIANTFSALIYNHPFLAAFLVPLIGGEPFFILLAFLAGTTGLIPLWILFLSGTTADILDDMFWFHVPRWKFFKNIKIPRFISKLFKGSSYKFKKIEEKELLFFVLTSKFLIGTRNFAIISISFNKIRFKKFLPISIISAIIWSFIVIGIGWSTGKGFLLAREIFDNTRIALSILVFFIFLIILIRYQTHKHIRKKLIIKKQFAFKK